MVLCLNVSAGIGIIGAASPMLQETFGGRLFGHPTSASPISPRPEGQAAAVGAAFVGLFSLFNIAGRFFWASLSDKIGRKLTYFIFFILGFLCYALAPTLATLGMLGAVRARLLRDRVDVWRRLRHHPGLSRRHLRHAVRRRHPWPAAHRLVDRRHRRPGDRQLHARLTQIAAGVPPDQIYHPIFYMLAGLLVAGFIANPLISPLDKNWFMRPEEVEALQTKSASERATHPVAST